MYRYMPPKSSIWGHSLRKMAPARQKHLFDAFLDRAVAERKITSASLLISSLGQPALNPIADVIQHFEILLNTTARSGHFTRLTEPQFDQCFATIKADPKLTSDMRGLLLLTQRLTVTKWRIDGTEFATNSHFDLSYGSSPSVTTFLTFESVDQFRFVQGVLAELRFCRLNEKHLKPVKTRTPK